VYDYGLMESNYIVIKSIF